jgi:hypothetical protein
MKTKTSNMNSLQPQSEARVQEALNAADLYGGGTFGPTTPATVAALVGTETPTPKDRKA